MAFAGGLLVGVVVAVFVVIAIYLVALGEGMSR